MPEDDFEQLLDKARSELSDFDEWERGGFTMKGRLLEPDRARFKEWLTELEEIARQNPKSAEASVLKEMKALHALNVATIKKVTSGGWRPSHLKRIKN